jgi:uncharacterized protein (DUF433 family)
MPSTLTLLRPTEAAIVAQVALRDVNRVIDERILPDVFFSLEDGRHVRAAACILISFYFASARCLTSEERVLIIQKMSPRLDKFSARPFATLLKQDWTLKDAFLTIDLSSFVMNTNERMNRLAAARQMVVIDPGILSGTPVIRNTRIPVYDIAASLAANIPVDRLLAAYPSLDVDQINLAKIYAEANPPRGRPRSAADIPTGAIMITDRRIPRRQQVG